MTLQEITAETLRPVLALSVSDEQQRFVAANAVSVAEAHFHPFAWFRAIYSGKEPAGFLMLHDEHLMEEPRELGFYFLWRFMIDRRLQGRGIGRLAMQQLIDHVRARPCAERLLLSHHPGEGNPGPFYEKCGFRYSGKKHDGELEMVLDLDR